MKKIVCIVLAVFIYAHTAFGYGSVQYDDFNEYKSKYRILYGALLLIGGTLLAYDGFRTIQVDISRPSVNMNFSSFWYKNLGANKYVINMSGAIVNTGNVDLQNVNVWIRYKTVAQDGSPSSYYVPSDQGKMIKYDGNPTGSPLANLSAGETKGLSDVTEYDTFAPGQSKNPPAGSEANSSNPDENVYHEQYPSATPTTLVDVVKIDYEYKKRYKDEMNNAYEGILGLLLVAGGTYLLIDYVISMKKFDYYMKKNNMSLYVENTFDEFKLMLSKRL
ncbi:MAG: hypothetical protein LBD46_04410 [Endomicrobium sp.]|jgi:hypothetical protein|nr:hypothetical protein [Endomicrobium sp.]